MTDYDSTLLLFSHSNKLECSIFDGALIVCVRVRACVRVRESGVYASAQQALKSAFFLRYAYTAVHTVHAHTKKNALQCLLCRRMYFIFYSRKYRNNI